MGALTSAIPGFGGLNNQASDLIKQLMSGKLTTGTKNAIYDAGAERATLGGMPGSTGMGGSLLANADLRNIGRAADDQQQRGFQDLLSMLTGYSGTVAPGAGQESAQDANSSLQQLLQSRSQAYDANQAKLSREHQQTMRENEANARNYWDPRWRNRNNNPRAGSLTKIDSFFGRSVGPAVGT